MEIKKAKYRKVRVLQTKEISPPVYGCDECREEIKEYPNEDSRLKLVIFMKSGGNAKDLHFCSWKCVLKFIPKLQSDYFVSLPHLYFDCRKEGKRSAKALQDILKRKKL